MSELEKKIQELNRKLALKQAFLSATISFPRGNKIPQDVKDEVLNSLRAAAADFSEGVYNPAVPADPGAVVSVSQFTEEEAGILKNIAATVKSKAAAPAQPSKPQPQAPQAAPVTKSEPMGLKKARLLMIDSLPSQYRNKVAPESEVYVSSLKDGKARITLPSGQSVLVEAEDLEFLD